MAVVANLQRGNRAHSFSRMALFISGAAFATVLGFSSPAHAQLTYSFPAASASLGISDYYGNSSFTATPITGTVGDTTTITAAGSTTGQFEDGPVESYTGSGSAQVSYAFDPNGITINVPLTATLNSLANGNNLDHASAGASAGASTDFMVTTTGLYVLNSGASFSGTANADLGGLFYTCQVEDFTAGGFAVNNGDADSSSAPDTHDSVINEPVTLIAGDAYSATFGMSIDPSLFPTLGASSTLTANGSLTLIAVPEPGSLSLLALTALSLAARRRTQRGQI